MKVITREFLNDNEYKPYPIDDRATFEPYTSDDVSVVNSLLTDIKLVLPRGYAAAAFVANITVTKFLITMTIMGAKEHPFSYNTPAATVSNDQYNILGAAVLGRIQIKRALVAPGTIVPVLSAVPGFGGWVVFGSGIQQEGSWSFAGPQSSMISDQCITRYDYGGVTSIGRQSYDDTVAGNVTFIGQNGVEAVKTSNGVAFQFSGISQQVKSSLANYVGDCGGRPESNTCSFTGIKSINGVLPSAGAGEIVLVLDKPLYAYLTDGNLGVSADTKLESFCKTRLQVPDNCAAGTAPAPLQMAPPTSNQVTPDPNIVLTVDVSDSANSTWSNFQYVQQSPNRATVAVYKTSKPISAFGELLDTLQVDFSMGQWQLYGGAGVSMYAYGYVFNNLRGNATAQYNGINYDISIGTQTVFDGLNYSQLKLAIDAPDEFEEAGIYKRVRYGVYVNEINPRYSIEVRGATDSTWVLLNSDTLAAAGEINSNGTGTGIQNYSRANGEPAIRTFGISGA